MTPRQVGRWSAMPLVWLDEELDCTYTEWMVRDANWFLQRDAGPSAVLGPITYETWMAPEAWMLLGDEVPEALRWPEIDDLYIITRATADVLTEVAA